MTDALSAEVDETAELAGEKRATVLRLAIRAGLPIVSSRFRGPLLVTLRFAPIILPVCDFSFRNF